MLRAALLTVLIFTAFPAASFATVRTGTIGWVAPETPPSLAPRLPETQTNEYIDTIAVAYDDQAGTLTFDITIYDAAHWTEHLPELDFALGPHCDSARSPDLITAGAYYRVIRYQWDNPETGQPDTTLETEARLSRKGYDGGADGTVAPNGHGYTVSFTHPALAGLDLRCFAVRTNPEQWASELEDFEFFDGYAPLILTRGNATRLFREALASHYGDEWSASTRRWALCPREEFFPAGQDGDSPALALCMAQFKHAGRWRLVSTSLRQADSGPIMRRPWTRTWTRRWRKQPARCLRQVNVDGHVWSNDGTCPALMVSDLSYAVRAGKPARRAFWHGTNTAGFEHLARYRCNRRGRAIRCTNAVGDAFRWRR
jgi:hypothetical protein